MTGMTVNVPLDVFDTMRDRVAKLEKELALAIEQRDSALVNDSAAGGFGTSLLQMFRDHALTIIQFAVAELHPETVKNWPYKSLAAISHFLKNHPVSTQTDRELAMAFDEFCSECKILELARQYGVEKEIAKLPLSSLANNYEKMIMNLVQAKLDNPKATEDEKSEQKSAVDAIVPA